MNAFWTSRYFIGWVQKVRIGVPAFCAVHIFFRRRPAWECDFCICQHLCGARVLYGRFGPLWFSTRIAFDDTSNVIFVVLALMPLTCKRRAYSHTHTHAYRKYIAFARSVFRSLDFYFFARHISNIKSLQLAVLCLFDFGWFGLDHTNAYPSQTQMLDALSR